MSYTIYDQKIIFVLYDAGFSGNFIATLISELTTNDRWKISESGHCHGWSRNENIDGIDELLLDGTGDLEFQEFDDINYYVVQTHHRIILDKISKFKNSSVLVIAHTHEQSKIGLYNVFCKYMLEHLYCSTQSILSLYILIQQYFDFTKESITEVLSYAAHHCFDEDITTLYVNGLLTSTYHQSKDLQAHETDQIVNLPYSMLLDQDIDGVCSVLQKSIGNELSNEQQSIVNTQVKKYISKQEILSHGTWVEFFKYYEDRLPQVLDKLRITRPWVGTPTIRCIDNGVAVFSCFNPTWLKPGALFPISDVISNNNQALNKIQEIKTEKQSITTFVSCLEHGQFNFTDSVDLLYSLSVLSSDIEILVWELSEHDSDIMTVCVFINSLFSPLEDNWVGHYEHIFANLIRLNENFKNHLEFIKEHRTRSDILPMLIYAALDYYGESKAAPQIVFDETKLAHVTKLPFNMVKYPKETEAQIEKIMRRPLTLAEKNKITTIINEFESLYPANLFSDFGKFITDAKTATLNWTYQ